VRANRRDFLEFLGGAAAALAGRTFGAAAAVRGPPEIHHATSNTLFGARGERRPRRSTPLPTGKVYPGLPRVPLSVPGETEGLPLAEVVSRFSPSCGFRDEPLTVDELARLLHLANGVTGAVHHGGVRYPLRAAPSAGAQYAGEVYVVARRIEGIESALYSFAVERRALVRIRPGSFADAVADAVERPDAFRNAAAIVLLTNVFARYTWRYANRGYRYALIDTGHIGENLRLAAASAGLGGRVRAGIVREQPGRSVEALGQGLPRTPIALRRSLDLQHRPGGPAGCVVRLFRQ